MLLPGVLHGIQGLLGDAVQVHVPPVLQHLEGDVGTVDHRPGRLEARCDIYVVKDQILYRVPSHVRLQGLFDVFKFPFITFINCT